MFSAVVLVPDVEIVTCLLGLWRLACCGCICMSGKVLSVATPLTMASMRYRQRPLMASDGTWKWACPQRCQTCRTTSLTGSTTILLGTHSTDSLPRQINHRIICRATFVYIESLYFALNVRLFTDSGEVQLVLWKHIVSTRYSIMKMCFSITSVGRRG